MQKRNFSKEEKLAVVQELQSGKSVAEVCRGHEITNSMAYRWQREHEENPIHAFNGKGKAITTEARNAELERTVGRLYLENEFLKKVQQTLQTKLARMKKER